MDMSWSGSVPSSVPLMLPAVSKVVGGTCQASSTASFTFTWPKVTSLGVSLPSFRHQFLVDRAPSPRVFVFTQPCTARPSTPAVSTVGMVGTLEAGTPCTKPRVWSTFCYSASSCTSSLFARVSHAQQVCDDNDSVKLFRKFALCKVSLYTHA